jgi:hypothetical protein
VDIPGRIDLRVLPMQPAGKQPVQADSKDVKKVSPNRRFHFKAGKNGGIRMNPN